MEYFSNYWQAVKFHRVYRRKNHRVDDEYLQYRSTNHRREWYIGNMRHRKNGPAICNYINGKLCSMEWYYDGYKQNPKDRFTEVTLFESGQIMTIKMPPKKNTPIYVEYYKDEDDCSRNRIHFVSFIVTDYITNPYGIESVYFHKNGKISEMAFTNRVDYLEYILYNLDGTTVYEFTNLEPNGVYSITHCENMISVEYVEGFRKDKLSKCIYKDGVLVKTEYYNYDGLQSYAIPVYVFPIM